MINLDAGLAAIFVTVLIALISMGVAWGIVSERVKNNRIDIDKSHKENKADHSLIFTKLDEINRTIKNGGR